MGCFPGRLQAFQSSLATEPFLIITALMAVYIVLGILYESYIHPDHDSFHAAFGGRGRGTGALALSHGPQCHRAHRHHPADRHREEKRHHDDRFRAWPPNARKARIRGSDFSGVPAAFPADSDDHHGRAFGALPLAFGTGTGSELRKPLGITIIGGLIFSQMLTLYTTPVVYLYLDRMRVRWDAAHHLR